MPADPNTILTGVWDRLRQGRADAKHAFRTAALATADALGRPDARTVVLRRVDEAARTIDFQTDYRSPKCSGLQRNAAAAWLFWDSAEQLQLRIATSATLHTADAVADAEWERVPAAAREPYRAAVMPGAALEGPDAPPHGAAGDGGTNDGRANFVVARCTLDSLEWLRLEEGTWRRIRFTWPGGQPRWQWLAP